MKTKKLPSGYRMAIPTSTTERAFLTELIKTHIHSLCSYYESEFGKRNESWKCQRMGKDGYGTLRTKIDLNRDFCLSSHKSPAKRLQLRTSVTFTHGEITVWVEDARGVRASLEEYVRELVDAPYCPIEAIF